MKIRDILINEQIQSREQIIKQAQYLREKELDANIKALHSEKETAQTLGKVSCNIAKLAELGEVISFTEREEISKIKENNAQISALNRSIKTAKFIAEKQLETPAKLKSEFLETLFKETRLVFMTQERKIQLGKVMSKDLRAIRLGQIKCNEQGLCWPNTESHKLLVNWTSERLNSRYGHNEKREILLTDAQKAAQKELRKQVKLEREAFVLEKMQQNATFLAAHKAKRDKNETRTEKKFRRMNYAEQLKAKNKLLFG